MFYRSLGKRVFDLIVSIFALMFLAPLMLFVAIAIFLTDREAVFFVQERIGAAGKSFQFLKFRSMPVGTKNLPSDQLGKIRITPVGRFIRRTNIDELPQLLNILKGDMSLVGPRPALPDQKELLVARRANGAAILRPGLTGLAQINSYDDMPVSAKAAYDGRYVKELSFLSDIKLIFRTFSYLLRPPPVY